MMHLKALVFFCDLVSSFTGLIAAVYWFRSATVKYPSDLRGSALIGGLVDVNTNPLLQAVKKAARLNKFAASFTAAAAILLAISTLIRAFSAPST